MKTFLYLSVIFILTGCAKINVFEKSVHIPKQAWYYNYKPTFTFTITDTMATYMVYLVLRHTDAYKYNNLWLSLGSQAPGDTAHFQNINVVLANDQKGWEGIGMDDIYELRKIITPGAVQFKSVGNYSFTIAQIMREDPLLHILDVGIRVEKQ